MSPVKKEFIIVSVVCNEYKISVLDLIKPNHSRHPNSFTEPKYVCMYLMRKNTGYDMLKIANMFGYTKSASLVHASDWIMNRIFNDPFKLRLSKLEAILPEIFKIHK